jgi:hypothetical protein
MQTDVVSGEQPESWIKPLTACLSASLHTRGTWHEKQNSARGMFENKIKKKTPGPNGHLATFPTLGPRRWSRRRRRLLLLLLRKSLLQILFGGGGRRSRHLKRWRCVYTTCSTRTTTTTRPTGTGRPLIISRMRIIIDRFERIDVWGSAQMRQARPHRRFWLATTSFFFFRTPYHVYFALNHGPV